MEVREGDKVARFTPYDGYKLGFTIEFDHPMIPAKQSRAELDFSTAAYIKEISRARTFGFMRDLEYMRERNLDKEPVQMLREYLIDGSRTDT